MIIIVCFISLTIRTKLTKLIHIKSYFFKVFSNLRVKLTIKHFFRVWQNNLLFKIKYKTDVKPLNILFSIMFVIGRVQTWRSSNFFQMLRFKALLYKNYWLMSHRIQWNKFNFEFFGISWLKVIFFINFLLFVGIFLV